MMADNKIVVAFPHHPLQRGEGFYDKGVSTPLCGSRVANEQPDFQVLAPKLQFCSVP